MNAPPIPDNRIDPRSARPATGYTPDGELLYHCERCDHHLRRSRFDCNEHGRVNTLCRECERITGVSLPAQRVYKDRSHITVTEKTCNRCGQTKPASNYWLDGKSPDGLKYSCRECELEYRRAYQVKRAIVELGAQEGDNVQPIIDQAVKERDQAVAELKHVQELVDVLWERDRKSSNEETLALLNNLTVQLDVLRDNMEKLTFSTNGRTGLWQRLISRTARSIGPVAFKVYRWADNTVVGEDPEE